jgi:hypothetical protein
MATNSRAVLSTTSVWALLHPISLSLLSAFRGLLLWNHCVALTHSLICANLSLRRITSHHSLPARLAVQWLPQSPQIYPNALPTGGGGRCCMFAAARTSVPQQSRSDSPSSNVAGNMQKTKEASRATRISMGNGCCCCLHRTNKQMPCPTLLGGVSFTTIPSFSASNVFLTHTKRKVSRRDGDDARGNLLTTCGVSLFASSSTAHLRIPMCFFLSCPCLCLCS